MDFMNQIWGQVINYVSVPYLLIFILAAYLVKTYLGVLLQKWTKFHWKPVYTVFAIATLIAVPFLLFSEEGWVKILFTYCLGTSLHELIFQFIENKIRKK